MQCNDIQEKLSAYMDGDFSYEERMLIEEHLKSCQKCNETLAEMMKTNEYVKNLVEIEPPAWMTQKIMAKIRSEAVKNKSIWQKLFYPLHIKLPFEAALAVLLALTTVYTFRTMQPEIKLARAPIEEMAPQMPFKETKATDKDSISRQVDIVKGKTPHVSRPQTVPLEKRDEKLYIEESLPSGGAVAKDELRQKTITPTPALRALAEMKKEIIFLTVFVQDIKKGRENIIKVVAQSNGEITKTESIEDKDILIVELNYEKLNDLIEKLKLIGEVKDTERNFDGRYGNTEITIEIMKESKQSQ